MGSFTVTNGVRQRGVLIPYLFAINLEFSYPFGSTRAGWTMGNMVVNHLLFVDDIPYVCLVLASLVFNAFYIFVVTMLLNIKSCLIVKRQWMCFFP